MKQLNQGSERQFGSAIGAGMTAPAPKFKVLADEYETRKPAQHYWASFSGRLFNPRKDVEPTSGWFCLDLLPRIVYSSFDEAKGIEFRWLIFGISFSWYVKKQVVP